MKETDYKKHINLKKIDYFSLILIVLQIDQSVYGLGTSSDYN